MSTDSSQQMITIRRVFLGAAWLAFLDYGVYSSINSRNLETQLREATVQPSSSQAVYSFDDSFIQHFGQAGVASVNRAISQGITDPDQVARELNNACGLSYDVR